MKKHKNLLLLAAIIAIILGAFLFAPKGVEYSGTDDAAENAISNRETWELQICIPRKIYQK